MPRGNMPGLAKHIQHMIGPDPQFFTKCKDNPEVQKIAAGYDIDAL